MCPAPTATVAHPIARSHRRARPDARTAPGGRRRRRARKPQGAIGENGRGKGFTDSDPTSSVALDPTRRQMRAAVRRAAALILRAEDELTEASAVIANGYLRLDHQEWIRVVEKRSAALQDR